MKNDLEQLFIGDTDCLQNDSGGRSSSRSLWESDLDLDETVERLTETLVEQGFSRRGGYAESEVEVTTSP